MKALSELCDEVSALEGQLGRSVEQIARELLRPTVERDTGRIGHAMVEMERLHGPLKDLGSRAHKAAKDPASDRGLRRQVRDARFRLKLWEDFHHIMDEEVPHGPRPLFMPRPKEDGRALFQRLVASWTYNAHHANSNPLAVGDPDPTVERFGDIALSFWDFVETMHATYRVALAQKRPRPMRFLDVGCGGGTKLQIASALFEEVHGLEIEPQFAAAARDQIARAGPSTAEIIEGDALKFEGYGAYDIVYFYWPIRDPDLLALMHARIVEMVRPGTILVAPYEGFVDASRSLDCVRLKHWIYVAGITASEAEDLIGEAELMGLHVWQIKREAARLGYWLPLSRAARANGYAFAS